MHLRPNADSVVPTGLDVGATLIPGLKPGAIFFRPFGTAFVRGATTCPRSDRMGSHEGLPLQGMRMGNPECGDSVPPFLQPRRGDREEPGV